MLVYGDHDEIVDGGEWLDSIRRRLRSASAGPAGIERHSMLVAALVDLGRLLQGIADADFAASGRDRRTSLANLLTDWLSTLAREVWRAWSSGFIDLRPLAEFPPIALPPRISLRLPEGFAFYSVYPEAYGEAAQRLTLHAPPLVIGIRSIGTTLGAMVAAVLGADRPVTVRPTGDPLARHLSVAEDLAQELLAHEVHYVVVDEGPGQSGSSFGAVADWLQNRGVPLERIAFITSHAGSPGRHASHAARTRWSRAQREVGDLGPRLGRFLPGWAQGLLGPLDSELVDLSAGRWREIKYDRVDEWPPANPAWERRKFLARAGNHNWLLKFAGLGSSGEAKLERARVLHQEGLVAQPLGLVHGFIVERWHEDGRPLVRGERPIGEVGRYLRARLQLSAGSSGASLFELFEMAQTNMQRALGAEWAGAIGHWQGHLARMATQVRRVETDNRMDRHEWLRLADGRLLKSDALDHCAGHDLIGCQDIMWDVAGAIVEFELDERQSAELCNSLGDGQREVDPNLLRFLVVAYLAFRLGQSATSAEMCVADAAESGRLKARSDRYAARLRAALDAQSPAAVVEV